MGAAGSVSRSQNTVYVMPHDWASIAQFLGPLLQRIDEQSRALQLIVVASDAELAAAVAAAAVKAAAGRDIGVVAATSARRAARLIRLRPPQIVAGTAEALVELLRGAAIKVDTVRLVCLAWADEIVVHGALPPLETLMAELPKESSRTVVTSELTPAVEEILERYARRARRIVAPAAETAHPSVNVEYVAVSAQTRIVTLRRVLDELDPQSAMIFVRESDGEAPVRELIRSLGYRTNDPTLTIGLAAAPGTDLVVLCDLPASREELREAAGAAKRTVALIQPRQLPSLRTLAAGGTVMPLTLAESGLRARDRDSRARAELREVLQRGQFGRELLSLEPLLEEFDGIEIAAAALQLLEQERAVKIASPSIQKSSSPAAPSGPVVRLFITVGSRDNARPSDLVGAIANQAGISGSEVGKIDVRESHSIVEVSASVADAVIERVNGTEIRGRRAVVRLDEERPRRERSASGPRGSRESREPRGSRESRESRESRGPRGPRSGPHERGRDRT